MNLAKTKGAPYLFLLATVWLASARVTYGQAGTYLGKVTFATDCGFTSNSASRDGVGITFDGTNLWYSCYNSASSDDSQHRDLFKANPKTGAVLGGWDIQGGLGAIAYDATRKVIWASQGGDPNPGWIIEIPLDASGNASNGNYTLAFQVPDAYNSPPTEQDIVDGLALDATTGILYVHYDFATEFEKYSTNSSNFGAFLGYVQQAPDIPGGTPVITPHSPASSCVLSGLAVGGNTIFQDSNYCDYVWAADKSNPQNEQTSNSFNALPSGASGYDNKALTCDTSTFSGFDAIWIKDVFNPVAYAFELQPGTCGVGGKATGTSATLSPGSLTFASRAVGTTSPAQKLTLANSGGTALSISSIAITGTNSGDYAETNNCGSSLAAGANCAINVTFKPTAGGTRTAALTVTDNASNSPQSASLSGTAVVITATLSPSSLSFGNQRVSTTSAAQSLTFSNTGQGAVTISSVTMSGTNPGDFAQSNNCGSSVAVGASCSFNVTFKPTATGARGATLKVSDNASSSPQSAILSGTGIIATAAFSPASLSFGSQNVGTTSAGQSITISNSGNASLSISSIAITGTNSGDFAQSNNCGSSLAAGSNCGIKVTFTPSGTGTRTANLTVTDNALNSPQHAGLSGTGALASAAFSGLTASQTIVFGTASVALGGTISAGSRFPPSGEKVTVSIGSTACPAAMTSANGTFSTACSTNSLAASFTPYVITYSYAGDSDFTSAKNSSTTLTVNKAGQTITFSALPNKIYGAAPFAVSATASSGLTVTFTSTTTSVCTTSGTNGSTVTLVAAGTCTIQTSQAGNSNYKPAPTVTQSFAVAKVSLTLGGLSPSQSIVFGAASVTLSGTISAGSQFPPSGEKVSVSIGSTACPAAILGANGTFSTKCSTSSLAASSTPYVITYSYPGDADFAGAKNSSTTLTVNKAGQTITFSALANKTFGNAPITVSATASSGLAVTFTSATSTVCTTAGTNGSTVTLVAAGTCTIQASQAGDNDYNAATSVNRSFAVAKASPTFSGLTASQSMSFGTASVTLAGKVCSTSACPPSGETVNVTIGNGSGSTGASCSASIGAGGTLSAACNTGSIAASSTPYAIVYSYVGDGNFNAAPDATGTTLTVSTSGQTINFAALSNKTYGNPPFTVNATASSGLKVTFASTTASVCTVSGANGSTITLLVAGTCTIQASQAGNSNYKPAPTVSQSFTVAKATPQFSQLTAPQSIEVGTASIKVNGTIGAGSLFPPTGETVDVKITGAPSGVNCQGATIGATGAFSATCNTSSLPASNTAYAIAYGYAGDSNFNAAPTDKSVTVTVQGFTMSGGAQSSASITPGQAMTSTIKLAAVGGFSGTVNFTCSVPPAMAEAACTMSPISSKTSSTLTVTTTFPAAVGPINGPGWLLPSGAGVFFGLLGLLLMTTKRRSMRLAFGLLVAGMLATFLVACGGTGNPGTPPGTYTITVTGTSGSMAPVTTTVKISVT